MAIINEAMAKRFWANGQDPLQGRIEVGGGSRVPERRIIGISGDVHYGGLGKDPGPAIYVPMSQVATPIYISLAKAGVPKGWVVRTRGDPAALSEAIKSSIGKATQAPVVDVEPMGRVLSNSVCFMAVRGQAARSRGVRGGSGRARADCARVGLAACPSR